MALIIALIAITSLLAVLGLVFGVLWIDARRSGRILVVLYHRVVSQEEYERIELKDERIFTISVERFREQMTFLRDGGYHPVATDRVLNYVEHGTPLPARPMLITFDDGSESVYSEALPILKEFDFPALLFVTTDPEAWIFRRGLAAQRRVTEDEIRELDRGGVTLGSHAVSHRPLVTMSADEIEKELAESKAYLEQVLEKPVQYFGVPLNWYGRRVREEAVRLGYRAVFTSDNGIVHRRSDPYHLKRFAIEGSYSLLEFKRSLTAGSIAQRRLLQLLKRIPARALGPRLWMPLREWLYASRLGGLAPQREFRRLVVVGLTALVALAALVLYLLVG